MITRPVKLALAFLGILLLGSLGYLLVEEGWSFLDALYMTVITITTIGYGEVHPLSGPGRVFTMLLVLLGLGLAGACVAQIARFMVETGIRNYYGKRKMKEKVARLREHCVVCGYGRIGAAICLHLHEMSLPFVVVESDPRKIEEAESRGFPTVAGDALQDGTLLAAGVRRARSMVLCINDDSVNINISLAARELNPELLLVVRGSDPAIEYRMTRAGADTVVYPLKLGGEQIARRIAGKMGATVPGEEVRAEPVMGYGLRLFRNLGEPLALDEAVARHGALRAAAVIRKDGERIGLPDPALVLEPGDAALMLVDEQERVRNAENSAAFRIEWSDDLILGAPEIDAEHRVLFQHAVEFQNSVLGGKGKEAVIGLFDKLVDYASRHFRNEEALMAKSGYYGLPEHVAEHRLLVERVMALNRDKRFIFSDNVGEFLSDWLKKHIMRTDREFAEYLRRKD